MDPLYVVIIAVAASAVVAAILIMVTKRVGAAGTMPGDVDGRVQQLEGELARLRDARSELDRRLAAEEQKAARVPALEGEISERELALDTLRKEKAVVDRDLATATEAASQTRDALNRMQARVTELDGQIRDAAERTEVIRKEKATLEDELATRREAVRQHAGILADLKGRLEESEKARADLQTRFEAVKDAKAAQEKAAGETAARLQEKTEAALVQRKDLEQTQADLKATKAEAAELQARHAKLQETLSQEMKQADARLALLQEAREQLGQQFRVLAEDVMKSHGETFTKQNKEQLDGLLTPLKDKLTEFQQGLQTAQTDSAKERATLAEQIRSLTETSLHMSQETQNLTRALKGKAQTQGAWGEMILSTILERSGLRKGEEYITQESHSADDGTRLRPDVVVNLPNSERLIIDAKVSLTAFNEYVNAEDDAERAACMARHLTSVRTHIRTLAGKEYQNTTGNTVDFVVMFVPIEGALAAALQEDPSLTTAAAEAHVAIATPSTLMMALRTVGSLWQIEKRNQNAEAIARRAGLLYDKFHGFVGDMQKLGSRLGQARESYEEAMGKLTLGRGNIIGQIEQLKGMGAKTAKSLPAELLGDEELAALPAPEVVDA